MFPLSKTFQHIYTDQIMKEAKIERLELKINGPMINELSNADDKVIISDSEAQTQKMISKINHAWIK